MPVLKERAKTLKELSESIGFLTAARPLALDEKAKQLLSGDAARHLAALGVRFEAAESWSAGALEQLVRGYAEEVGLKLGQAAQPLRAALTGRSVSPPVFDVLEALGRGESVARVLDYANLSPSQK
jgi:glutamyl-tRNA synthetase